MNKRMKFLKVALRDKDIGAVTMTSKYVADDIYKILGAINLAVEYGPGEGILTKTILKRLNPNGKLFVIEPNGEFVQALHHIGDARIHIIRGIAQNITKELAKLGVNKVDVVISSLPFSFLKPADRLKVLQDTYKILSPNGSFIVFQYSLIMRRPLQKIFSRVSVSFKLRNIPPGFLIIAQK